MASETSSSLVLFIAAMAIAAIAAAAMAGVVGSVAHELRDRGNRMADAVATDLAIVNDPDNVPYNASSNELTLYIKNTGSATLVEDELLVLVDGQDTTFNTTLLEGAETWRPGDVARLTVSASLTSGDHRVRVTYGTIADDLEFRI